MKPPRSLSMNHGKDDLRYFTEQASKTMSNISFGTTTGNTDRDQNVQCWKATGTSPGAPNTAFTVTHNLPHVPFGFHILRMNAAARFYDSGVTWTAATKTALGTISLKCDIATVAFTIMIL